MQQSESQSSRSYHTAVGQYDCTCELNIQNLIVNNDQQMPPQIKQITDKLKIIHEQHKHTHQQMANFINKITDSIECTEILKNEFIEMIKKQQTKCINIIHRQAQQQILLGTKQILEANLLLNKLTIRYKNMKNTTINHQEESHKQCPKPLDTTVDQPSFIEVQNPNNDNPFADTYKTSVFCSDYRVYQTENYEIRSIKHNEGIEIKIISFDNKYRVISIDQGVPSESVMIKWDKLGNSKFLSDCKIILEQTQIPIPLPINYLFERRFSKGLPINLERIIKQKLIHKKKFIIKNPDLQTFKRLEQFPSVLGLMKQDSKLSGIIVQREPINRQLYMIDVEQRKAQLQVTLRTSKQSQFFKDIIQFLIFLLSS